MTAQPLHHARPPRIPSTVKGIRASLPTGQLAAFDAQWQDLDLGDLPSVARFRDTWWCRAVYATDPTIAEDFAAFDRGDLEFVAGPFAR